MRVFEAMQKVFTRETPDKVIPTLAYSVEDGLFWTEDGYLGACFMSHPMAGVPEGADEKLAGMLNIAWPAETMMQFGLYNGPVVNYIKSELRSPHSRTGELLQRADLFAEGADLTPSQQVCKSVIERKVQFMEEGISRPLETVAGTTTRDAILMVSIKYPCKTNDAPTQEEVQEAKELTRRVKQTLESIGLLPTVVSAKSYIRFMHSILNWSDSAYWKTGEDLGYDENRFINQQIVDLDNNIQIDEKGVWLSEKKRVVSISPRKLPDYMSLFTMAAALGDPRAQNKVLPGNFLINVNLYWPDFHKAKGDIETQRNYAVYQSFGVMGKFVPRIQKRRDSFDTLFESIEAGERAVKICPSILVFADNEQKASEMTAAFAAYYTELGYQMQEDSFLTWPLLLNALPLCADRTAVKFLKRYHTVAGSHASQFMPISGDWKGTGTAMMQFYGRFGQPQFVDLFDSETNFNLTIAAESGSGKSFLTNDMIVSYISSGAKVWVIDVGRSYIKLCRALDGDFLEFSTSSGICLNPFPLVQEYDEEADMLIGLIMAMAFPTEKPTDYQLGKLKEIMKTLWEEKGRSMTIDDVADRCKGDDDPDHRIKDIGEQIFSFTSRGEYGRFFVGENNVRFENNFTVLELEELKGREHLQQVVLLQLIYQIQQTMYLGSRKVRKMVIVDEAWDLLSKGNVSRFIEAGYRRFRKYNGCAVTITQSVNDLYKNPAGVAIAENSANMILLGQKKETIDSLKRENRLSMGDGGFEILKTVSSVRGVFSEIFFYMNGGRNVGVGRLIVDRYTQLLYSTHPDDINAIEARLDRGMTMDQAIKDVIAGEARIAA